MVTDIRLTLGGGPVTDQPLEETFYSIGEQFAFRSGGRESANRRLSDPESPELARPSAPRAGASIVGSDRVLNVQESLDALLNKTIIDEAIKLLLSSLAPPTQAVYLR